MKSEKAERVIEKKKEALLRYVKSHYPEYGLFDGPVYGESG